MPRPSKKKTTVAPRRRYSRTSTVRRSVRGYGGYWDNVKKRWGERGGAYKSGFTNAGAALGSSVGGKSGAVAGGLLGGLLNRALYALTGFGDYKVKSNALLDETNGPPKVINRGKEFVIRHREYIQDMYSASGAPNSVSAFAIQGYPIQPGSFTTFPWLASISDKFEQYRVEGMIFEFKSMYSDAVVTANGSIGSIILATEYNAGAPAFPNKQAMENYEFAQSCKPSLSVLHPIECARSQSVLTELYVRTSTVPNNEDVKTYDFGDFYFASQGIPLGAAGAAVNLGELWVTYQISFLKPKIVTGSSSYVDSGFAYFSGVPISPNPGQGNPGFVPYGTIPLPFNSIVRRSDSNIPVNITADNTIVFTLASVPMVYEVEAKWYSATIDAAAQWQAPTLSFVNCSSVNPNTTGSYQNIVIPSVATTGGRGCSTRYFIKVPAATPSAPTSTLVFGTADFKVSQTLGVRCEMFINAVPPGIVA